MFKKIKKNKHTIPINDLADEFKISTRTLRFYDQKGLLKPMKHGRNRFFCEEDRIRLKQIVRDKRIGFNLSEIKTVISIDHQKQNDIFKLIESLNILSEYKNRLLQNQFDVLHSLEELNELQKSLE